MFRGSYQRKLLTILYSGGSNPLEIWEIKVKNGWTRRLKDDDLGTIVFEVAGTNVATAYIVSPPDPRGVLGISLPFITMIIKNLKRYFTFEIQVLDDKQMRRRFRFSNYQSSTKVRPFTCSVPLALKPGWNQMQLNLANFTMRAYGTQYLETQRVQIHANCRIRRVYFSDRLYTEEELPRDYRIYLNVRQAPQPEKDTKAQPILKQPSKDMTAAVGAAADLVATVPLVVASHSTLPSVKTVQSTVKTEVKVETVESVTSQKLGNVTLAQSGSRSTQGGEVGTLRRSVTFDTAENEVPITTSKVTEVVTTIHKTEVHSEEVPEPSPDTESPRTETTEPTESEYAESEPITESDDEQVTEVLESVTVETAEEHTEIPPEPTEGLPTHIEQIPEGSTAKPIEQIPEGSTVKPIEQIPEGSTAKPIEQIPEGSTAKPIEQIPEGSTAKPIEQIPEGSTAKPIEQIPEGSTAKPIDQIPEGSTEKPTVQIPEDL